MIVRQSSNSYNRQSRNSYIRQSYNSYNGQPWQWTPLWIACTGNGSHSLAILVVGTNCRPFCCKFPHLVACPCRSRGSQFRLGCNSYIRQNCNSYIRH